MKNFQRGDQVYLRLNGLRQNGRDQMSYTELISPPKIFALCVIYMYESSADITFPWCAVTYIQRWLNGGMNDGTNGGMGERRYNFTQIRASTVFVLLYNMNISAV